MNFFEELYMPGPHEPAGVLCWGKSPEQTKSDLAAGVARIGGFRTPDYGQAYLLAANTLLRTAQQGETLDHHGLPIFFLQRHAAELMIKAPLQIGITIQQFREKLGHPRPEFPSLKQIERAERGHGLNELLVDLETMAKALQIGLVPDVLRLAIKEITQVEQSQHTWSRYSFRLEGAKSAKTRYTHLRDEIVIPLGRIQNLLQAANNALGSIWPADGSLMGMLGSQLQYLWREAGEID